MDRSFQFTFRYSPIPTRVKLGRAEPMWFKKFGKQYNKQCVVEAFNNHLKQVKGSYAKKVDGEEEFKTWITILKGGRDTYCEGKGKRNNRDRDTCDEGKGTMVKSN